MRHFRQHMKFAAEARVHREELPPEQRAAKDELQGVHSFRSHLGWYAHGLHGASVFRAQHQPRRTGEGGRRRARAVLPRRLHRSRPAPETEQELDYRTALG